MEYMKHEQELTEKLRELAKGDIYPFHMPGHKRNPDAGRMSDYFDIDITEIEEFDNLHDAEGIIFEAEKRANELYGADETHLLVNGSTCGVLSAVSAAAEKGSTVIAGRNCHKSFYHAAYLRELDLRFVLPEDGIVTARDISRAFDECHEAKAVFITSPTYEGVVSDVRAIAEVAHEHGAVLIVDEAHGAHFGMHEKLPKSAVTEGADIVIHSVHKTLAAMTQTALIHVKGDWIDKERLRRFLRIYQSSSPSYVLMASIDSCISDLELRGREIMEKLLHYRELIEEGTKGLKTLFIPVCSEWQDPAKVLICSANGVITGQRIYDILRLDYRLQMEMAGDTYALAIITGYDTETGINRLIDAVRDIDKRINEGVLQADTLKDDFLDINTPEDIASDSNGNMISESVHNTALESIKDEKIEGSEDESLISVSNKKTKPVQTELPKTIIPFWKAWDNEKEFINIHEASGRLAGDFINLYPPGIPLVIPGELMDDNLIADINVYIKDKRNIQGVFQAENGEWMISCLKEN